MKILALDTSTEACSAALYIDGDIEHKYELAPREHTQMILLMIEQLLIDSDLKIKQLDALAFGRGPGSFTGVRISTGIVQGMAYAADLPVLPVSTLASIAQSVYDDYQHQHVLAAIDARMGEVYWSQYVLGKSGVMELLTEEQVIKPEQVSAAAGYEWVGAGTAWATYDSILNQALDHSIRQQYAACYPQSASIVRLAASDYNKGLCVSADQAMPLYLRNNVAVKSSARK